MMMENTRAVIVFLLWYYSTLPDFSYGIHKNTSTDLIWEESTNRSSEGRRHRIQMFFPLMLGISARLAALLPTALMILFGTFVFVALAKKAFVISLVALYIVLSRKNNKTEEERYPEENEEYETIEEHIVPGHYPKKHYYKRRHYPRKPLYHHKEWKSPLVVLPYVPVPMPVFYPYYIPKYQHFSHRHSLGIL